MRTAAMTLERASAELRVQLHSLILVRRLIPVELCGQGASWLP